MATTTATARQTRPHPGTTGQSPARAQPTSSSSHRQLPVGSWRCCCDLAGDWPVVPGCGLVWRAVAVVVAIAAACERLETLSLSLIHLSPPQSTPSAPVCAPWDMIKCSRTAQRGLQLGAADHKVRVSDPPQHPPFAEPLHLSQPPLEPPPSCVLCASSAAPCSPWQAPSQHRPQKDPKDEPASA